MTMAMKLRLLRWGNDGKPMNASRDQELPHSVNRDSEGDKGDAFCTRN